MLLTKNDPKSARATRSRGRPKNVEAGSRLHIYVPDTLLARLQEIQRDTHANSVTDVIKSALTLYAAAIEEHKKGGSIYFKRPGDQPERQLALFI